MLRECAPESREAPPWGGERPPARAPLVKPADPDPPRFVAIEKKNAKCICRTSCKVAAVIFLLHTHTTIVVEISYNNSGSP